MRSIQQKLSALDTTLQENMAGIKVLKAFTRERSEQRNFNQQADSLIDDQGFFYDLYMSEFRRDPEFDHSISGNGHKANEPADSPANETASQG